MEENYSLRVVTFRTENCSKTNYRIGALLQNKVIDLTLGYTHYLEKVKRQISAHKTASVYVPSDMRLFLEGGNSSLSVAKRTVEYVTELIEKAEEALLTVNGERFVFNLNEIKLAAPILNPCKLIFLGIAYKNHADAEVLAQILPYFDKNGKLPEPHIFHKPSQCIIGSGDTISVPKVSPELSCGAEICLVIGKKGKNIPIESADDYIVGYTIANDVTATCFYLPGTGSLKNKMFDTFAPLGPTIVTKDLVAEPNNTNFTMKINGTIKQSGNTRDSMFSFLETVSFISQVMTLFPGDLIATGDTGFISGDWKQRDNRAVAGDVVECEVEGVGTLTNTLKSEGEE